MKMFILLLVLSIPFTLPVLAQDETIKKLQAESGREIKKDPTDTSDSRWKKGGTYGLNIAQGSLSNWAAGGEDFSLSINSLLNLFAFYKKGRYSWDNTFDFNLGYVNTSSLGGRKNDDRFDLLSKYGYALNPKLNLSALFNLRSQIFRGYTFEDDVKSYSSNFLAPGYLLLGAGLDYKPNADLSIFFSPATARFIIVRDTALANKGLYGVDPGDKTALEFGAFATINYIKSFSETLSYKSRLDLFSNYLSNPQNIDIFMTNVLNVKLSKLLSLTWGLDLIYDDDVKLFGPERNSAAWQIKSLVGVGLLVKFD